MCVLFSVSEILPQTGQPEPARWLFGDCSKGPCSGQMMVPLHLFPGERKGEEEKEEGGKKIRSHLERVRQRDFEPDMILVDYGDILRPVKHNTEKRHELQEIYEQLRAIAQIYDCPVWTASQTNRSGLNAEVITMEAISEAFNKCFVADFIFSLSRTIEDKKANKGRVFIAKNRNGPDGLVYPVFADWSCVSLKVLEPQDETVDNTLQMSTKSTVDFLKSKYKNMKK